MKITAIRKVVLYIIAATASLLAEGANWSLNSLSTSDGLSDLLVNTIYKDRTGFIWFGTGAAIDRFDGYEIKTYQFSADNTAPKRTNAIAEDENGRIYAGSHQGLFRISERGETLEQLLPEKINFTVNSLLFANGGILYAGTARGLFRYNTSTGKSEQILIHQDALSHRNEISAVASGDGKSIWLATGDALHEYNLGNGKLQSYPLGHSSNVRDIVKIGPRLFLGTHGSGILVFDTARKAYLSPIGNPNSIVTSLSAESQHRLYAATDGDGIYVIDPGSGDVIDQYTSSKDSNLRLRSNSVYSTLIDNQGLLWVGYYGEGADYTPLTKDIFEVYRTPDGLNTDNMTVRAIAIFGDKKLMGTREGLFYINEEDGHHLKFQTPELRSNIVFCITPYSENTGSRHSTKYYIGTYSGGMYVFDPATRKIQEFDSSREPFHSGAIFCIEVDAHNNMWVGTSHGLYRFRGTQEMAHYTYTNSQLPEGNVYEIFFDSAGRGWICTETGMALWNGSELQSGDRFPKGFVNNLKIRDVYEDSSHELYFIPDRGQVFRSNMQLTDFSSLAFTAPDPGSFCTFVIEDNDHNLWFGTDKGLIRYDKNNGIHLFNKADGLPHQVFTLCKPVRDASGNIWMGNTRGLIKLDFERFRKVGAHPARLVLTDATSNGRCIIERFLPESEGHGNGQLALVNNENNISMSVSDLSYTMPDHRYIEYYLEGRDSNWHKLEGRGKITYFDLPKGKYLLRIRPSGDPSSETRVGIIVKPSIETWAMALYVFCFLSLALVAVVYIKYRRRTTKLAGEAQTASIGKSDEEREEKIRYKTTRLSDEECKRIMKIIENIMKTQKPYTNPDLKSSDLARMAGTTGHALSFVFNQYLKKSYYDYINEFRVEEFKRLAAEESDRYTLSAMAEKCGFSSRASFFRHFKSIAGMTPSEYVKSKQ